MSKRLTSKRGVASLTTSGTFRPVLGSIIALEKKKQRWSSTSRKPWEHALVWIHPWELNYVNVRHR